MKVLIVDDNVAKSLQIEKSLRAHSVGRVITIFTSTNIQDALNKCSKNSFDLVILDVMLPLTKGAEAVNDGGIRFLKAVRTQRKLNFPKKIIGLTAFEQIVNKYKSEFDKDCYTLLKYSTSSTDWLDKLLSVTDQIEIAEKSASKDASKERHSSLSAMEIGVSCLLLAVAIVTIYIPFNFNPIQKIVLFFTCSILSAIFFSKNIQSKFSLKIPGFCFSTAGSAAIALGTLLLLSHLTQSDMAISVFQVIDGQSKSVCLDSMNINSQIGNNGLTPTIFKKGNQIAILFPAGTSQSRIEITQNGEVKYAGQIRYVPDVIQTIYVSNK